MKIAFCFITAPHFSSLASGHRSFPGGGGGTRLWSQVLSGWGVVPPWSCQWSCPKSCSRSCWGGGGAKGWYHPWLGQGYPPTGQGGTPLARKGGNPLPDRRARDATPQAVRLLRPRRRTFLCSFWSAAANQRIRPFQCPPANITFLVPLAILNLTWLVLSAVENFRLLCTDFGLVKITRLGKINILDTLM